MKDIKKSSNINYINNDISTTSENENLIGVDSSINEYSEPSTCASCPNCKEMENLMITASANSVHTSFMCEDNLASKKYENHASKSTNMIEDSSFNISFEDNIQVANNKLIENETVKKNYEIKNILEGGNRKNSIGNADGKNSKNLNECTDSIFFKAFRSREKFLMNEESSGSEIGAKEIVNKSVVEENKMKNEKESSEKWKENENDSLEKSKNSQKDGKENEEKNILENSNIIVTENSEKSNEKNLPIKLKNSEKQKVDKNKKKNKSEKSSIAADQKN
ncbi:hypothetical protein EDEG_01906 [Edhazardia aedis USNM 41457]|uniref:Uncharacterized protein n=1 Tax=Edhazardia aedis (strain USNM 41457) TaxID=1003232 RepID=J9D8G6_EDHAE|nr:hypothetical protein EDEG_01906 [Edhazardia aedis USNM 41457]|eukprot:EJW03814.1 hypothetical protein EDEG_01906 [Edhazardia aedis USNM 41457]